MPDDEVISSDAVDVSGRRLPAADSLSEPRLDPSSNLAKFIAAAKSLPALKGVHWDSSVWQFDDDDPVAKKKNAHKSDRNILMFSNRETSTAAWARRGMDERIPMTQPFLDFARACIRHHAQNSSPGITVLRKEIAVLGVLEKTLRCEGGDTDPTRLGPAHFTAAEKIIAAEYSPRTAYKMSNLLALVSGIVDQRRLSFKQTRYTTGISRPNDGDELTDRGQTEGAEKMVSDEVLEALAKISSNPKNDRERLVIRLVGLLFSCGFRLGELLTIPVNCWVEEGRRCGIRYAPKKMRELRVKWIPATLVPLAKLAVDDLTWLCDAARTTARWMAANPGRIRQLSRYAPDAEIQLVVAMKLLSVVESTTQFVSTNHIETTKRGGALYARVGVIEAALLVRYRDPVLVTVLSGKEQRLGDSLIVIFENQLHQARRTLEFLPRMMTAPIFSGAIALSDNQVADRKANLATASAEIVRGDILAGKVGASGEPLFVTSHQFRHWLNTMASNEGVSDLDLDLWMGRKDIEQTEAYKHLTVSKRTKLSQQLVLDGQIGGSVARIASTMNDLVERKKYVEARIQTAHTTPYGACFHPYAANPCTRHMQCLSRKGCGSLGRTKGNQEERAELLRLKGETEGNLTKAKEAMSADAYNASNWVRAQQDTLMGINAALAVDELIGIQTGDTVRVFPDAKRSPPNHEQT